MNLVHVLPEPITKKKQYIALKTMLCCLGLVGTLPIGLAASSAYIVKERGYYIVDCHRRDQCLLSMTSPMHIRELVYIP